MLVENDMDALSDFACFRCSLACRLQLWLLRISDHLHEVKHCNVTNMAPGSSPSFSMLWTNCIKLVLFVKLGFIQGIIICLWIFLRHLCQLHHSITAKVFVNYDDVCKHANIHNRTVATWKCLHVLWTDTRHYAIKWLDKPVMYVPVLAFQEWKILIFCQH